MISVIKITLPIYYNDGKTSQLVGMNKYMRMNPHARNKMTKHYYQLIRYLSKGEPIYGQYRAKYTLFYKNPLSDAPNIVSVIEKLLMDGLQECGKVQEDNCKFYLGGEWDIGGMDVDSPRVEIEVYEVVKVFRSNVEIT